MVSEKLPAQREGWDFYADPAAVAGYVAHRDEGMSRNSLIEEPDFLALLGDVTGRRCLDLGCGYGHYAEKLASGGASVVGVDRSELMIAQARARRTADLVEYIHADIDVVEFPEQSYDVIISNLALHYLPDPAPLFARAYGWLRTGGRLVYSVEHPLLTANREEQLWCDEGDDHRQWIVSDYFDERDRWGYFGRKYHHTISTWLNAPLACGLQVTAVAEPRPPSQVVAARPEFAEDLHRPLFLIVSCAKTGGGAQCE